MVGISLRNRVVIQQNDTAPNYLYETPYHARFFLPLLVLYMIKDGVDNEVLYVSVAGRLGIANPGTADS